MRVRENCASYFLASKLLGVVYGIYDISSIEGVNLQPRVGVFVDVAGRTHRPLTCIHQIR